MIVGLPGIIATSGGSAFPPYGTLLSSSCTSTSVTDAQGTIFTGYYNQHLVYADGFGGTYDTNSVGDGNCYYPYGYYFNYSQYSFGVSWSGCDSSGTLYSAGTWQYSVMADGTGGTIGIDNPVSWNYSNGDGLYDNMMNCRVILNTSSSPWYTVETYGGNLPYGTKIGYPYWNNDIQTVYMTIADGTGGVIQCGWDSNSPWPENGTQIAASTYNCGSVTDAIGTYWYLCFYGNTYGDGFGGSYGTSTIDGNYPNGYAQSGYQVFNDEFDYGWYVLNDSYYQVYPWRYGYIANDGYGNTYKSYSTPYYGAVLSDDFTDTNSFFGRIIADGDGGYYFSSY